MTAGFTTERQDPDLQRVSAGELRILQGAELDGAMETSDES